MSEASKGLLAVIAAPIAEELANHQNLPSDKKNDNRAYFGAFLLGIRLRAAAARYWMARGLGPRHMLGAFFAVCVPLGAMAP